MGRPITEYRWLKPETYQDPRLPEHLRGGLEGYIEEKRPVGHFLTAVLTNDLFEAMSRADATSRAYLPSICEWIYNEAPSSCWGSPEKVTAWLSAE